MLQQSSPQMQAPRPESAPPAGAQRSSVLSMVDVTIQRLEEIIDQETHALRARKAIDFRDFNNRKSQALLELTRSLRLMQGTGPDPALAARVGALKVKLAVNQAALKVHLDAMREISTSLSEAIRNADSDGTYTQAISSAAGRP